MEAGNIPHHTKSSHSWWRDSHKSFKHSKWLEDNLKDMEEKMTTMRKLIDKDADSFAKRAEMYYQRRPELMSLVDEFHRSYRALAERYDQQQGSFQVIPPDVLEGYGISVDPSHTSPNSHIHRLKTSLSSRGIHKADDSSSSSSSSDSEPDTPSPTKSSRGRSDNDHHPRHVRRGGSSSAGKGLSEQKAMEQQLIRLQEELKALESQNSQLSMEKTSATTELSCLQEEMERLKKENTELGLAVTVGTQKAMKWEEEEKELHNLRALLESSEGLRNALEQQLRKLQEELEIAKIDAMEAMENLSQRDKQVKNLEEEAGRREGRIEALQKELEGLHDEKHRGIELSGMLQEQLSDLQQELSQARDEVHRLSSEVIHKTAAMEKLQEGIQKQEEIVADLRRVISAMQEEERILRNRLEERCTEAESLHLQVQKLQVLLDESRSQNHGLEEQWKALQRELQVAESNAKIAAENLISERDSVVKKLEEAVGTREETIQGLQKELASFHGERDRGIELTDILEKQLTDLKQELATTTEQFRSHEESWKLEKSSLEEAIPKVLKEKQELQIALDLCNEQVKNLETQIKNLETQLANLTNQWREAEESCRFHQAEHNRVQSELSERSEMVHKLEEELESMLKTLQHLMHEENGSSHRSFHGDGEHSIGHIHLHEPKHHTLRNLKDGLVRLLTDRKEIKDESMARGSLVNDLREQISSLQAELDTLQSASMRKDEENLAQCMKLDAANVLVIELQKEIDDSKKQAAKLMFDIEELRRAKAEEEERHRLSDAELREALAESKQRINGLLEESTRISEKYSETTSEIGHLQILLSDLSKVKESLESEIMSGAVRIADLTESMVSIEEKNRVLDSELQAKQEKVRDLEERLAESTEKNEELNRALKSGSEEMMFLTQEMSKLQGIHGKLQTERGLLIHEKERSLDEHKLVRQALEEVEKELAAENSRNSLLEIQLKEARSKIQELEAMISRLEAEKKAFSLEISYAMSEFQRRSDDLQGQLQQKIQELESADKNLGAENDRNSLLEASLKEASSRTQELEAMVSQLETEKKAFSVEIASMASLLSHAQRKTVDLEGELMNARSDLSAEREQSQLKSQEMEELTLKLKLLHEERMSVGMELEQKVQDYVKLEAAMADLSREHASLANQKETLSEELALGARTIRELEEEAVRMRSAKHALEEAIARETRKLEEEEKKWKAMHDSKEYELQALNQRFKTMREEKISFGAAAMDVRVENFKELQTQVNELLKKIAAAELAVELERRKGDERQSIMQQQVASLREENQRQGFIITDRSEEKRQAINQLCIAIDLLQEKNKSLKGTIATARVKLQQRSIPVRRGWNFWF